MGMLRNFVKVMSLRVHAALAPLSTPLRTARGGGSGGSGGIFPEVNGEVASLDFPYLQDIYTFAAYSHAAYCPHNWDGLLGNPVCQAASAITTASQLHEGRHHDDSSSNSSNDSNSTTASANHPGTGARASPEARLLRTGCAIYGSSQTIAELTEEHDIAGNVVVNHAQRLLVVTFRGTSRAWEWMRDLQAAQDNAPELRCGGDCRVHSGFRAAFLNVRGPLNETLEACLREHPAYRVVVTGHSYGGAVATLVGAYLRFVAGVEADIFTYGAPRVGNVVFAERVSSGMTSGAREGPSSTRSRMRKMKGRQDSMDQENEKAKGCGPITARVTNRQDIVTAQPPMYMWLPFGPVEYAHTTPEYWFERGFGELSSSSSSAATVGDDGPEERRQQKQKQQRRRLPLDGLRVCRGVQHVGCSAQFSFLNLLTLAQRIADHGGYHVLSAPCPADKGRRDRLIEDVLPTVKEVMRWQWGNKLNKLNKWNRGKGNGGRARGGRRRS
ncbi:hypothetical protein JDV02_009675 [Purpureocillium takamizusanense]|uniref:Fungal lipase-type domain-containing protein n=1 Tax=Purpureocillium takamizusanense TaxID=2060973 RepID=A0A9Q8VFR4_9HYPO|nr:uncharacterized protein JDV02_009675 [Purpureocillium takamizusanense]UNI23883.1 hypothetical protein JDV02_009675 [Purpureocillium takamizusanense]